MGGRWFAGLLVVVLCAACDTTSKYRVGSSDIPVSRASAEQALINDVSEVSARYVPSRLDAPLQLIFVRLPEYPLDALRTGAQGDVGVVFTVAEDGSVRNVEVERGPNPFLRNAAIWAVKQWRFKPPTRDGAPTTIRVLQRLTFTLP